MLFNCATGLKYPLPRAEQSLDRHHPPPPPPPADRLRQVSVIADFHTGAGFHPRRCRAAVRVFCNRQAMVIGADTAPGPG